MLLFDEVPYKNTETFGKALKCDLNAAAEFVFYKFVPELVR